MPVLGESPSRYIRPLLVAERLWTSSVVNRLPDGVRKNSVSPSFIPSNRNELLLGCKWILGSHLFTESEIQDGVGHLWSYTGL